MIRRFKGHSTKPKIGGNLGKASLFGFNTGHQME